MYRALSVPKGVGTSVARGAVRVVRRRLATETPAAAPKKRKNVFRRIVFFTAAGTATFYAGGAFIAVKFPPYGDIFVQNVPGAATAVQYAEDHNWDTLTVQKTLDFGLNAFDYARGLVTGERHGERTPTALEKTREAMEMTKDVAVKTKEAAIRVAQVSKSSATDLIQESKDRIKSVTSGLKTSVERNEAEISKKSAKAAAIARSQSAEFSEGVEDLVQRAEAALADKPADTVPPEVITTPTEPTVVPETVPAPANGPEEVTVRNVYNIPLPIGFEPPPGYSRPTPSKPTPVASEFVPAEQSVLEPLPLVAPVVAEFSASEPFIAQLATVIDDLASYLNANPTAADKARDILDTAKVDLTGLASRIEQVKEQERAKLEATLDEQTRDYTIKLLQLEMEAQDKLDNQENDFRKYFEEEKAKFVHAYREKLNHELQTQSEIINERLKEEVIAQGIEMQRRWIREIKVRVEQERGGRLAKLDELASNLKRLERIAVDNSAYLDENIRIHALWSALRALNSSVDAPVRKPFREELRVLRHIAAAREDPIVSSVLEMLEASDVPDVGVEPFADLASWFSTSVSPRVSSVALVPDENAGVLSHLASHLFSTFQFPRHGLVPGSDVLSVLARAEYHMNEKDLDSAARELNQLKGTAKVLLTDWLDAARKRLEVLQALEVVQAQATLASLLVAHE
ncbi:mitochondrial inner membrane protein Mitofilin [Sparassis latifolia]|uniref:MICOS complex subunit MIC60 n=1 Tax=Sparassis crispa TaxID=139825 RepID=A0A401H0F4_9APHY|nr:MICOS complex subunit MIC60 [Sparassis crispa]GBE87894.1 MICOS complex subunit MIC60 [Sparassis crispa]